MSTSDLASFSAIPVRGGDAYIFTLPKGTTPQACRQFALRFEKTFGHLEPGPVAFVVTEDVGVRWVEHMAMEQVAVVVDAWREENAKVDALEGRVEASEPA